MTKEVKEIKQAQIWAVGGGKGGTGKTFVITQLAIYLASRGFRVVLVDTDFGGANLHSFFGIKRPFKTIVNFFDNKEPLENLLINTYIENLQIIPGDYLEVSAGNMKYAQKTKLLKHIKRLNADYVLLDLGGGTSTDTVDAFLLADRLILVTIPEITSIENLFQFVKNVFFRKLKFILSDNKIKDPIRDVWLNREKHGIFSILDLLNFVKNSSSEIDEVLNRELADFSLFIVLNMVRNAMEIQEGFSVRSVCIKHIGIEAYYAGYIEYDYQFWKSLSLIDNAPRLSTPYRIKKDIMEIAENIIHSEQLKLSSIKNV